MLREAPVLVLDEPTAYLDSVAARQVIQPLRRLMSGRTTIMITHDLSLAPDADRILVVEGGHLVESGTHAELVARRGAYARLAGPLPELAITGRQSDDTVTLRAVPPRAPDETRSCGSRSARSGRGRSAAQAVPEPPHGVDEPRSAAALQFPPQVHHIHVKGVGRGLEVEAPHVPVDTGPGERGPRMLHQVLQQHELGPREIERLTEPEQPPKPFPYVRVVIGQQDLPRHLNTV